MIVITKVDRQSRTLLPGDKVQVTWERHMFPPEHPHPDVLTEEILSQDITVTTTIDCVMMFQFADDSGRVLGFHMSAFIGRQDELPLELQNGVMFQDLSHDQKRNFLETCGMRGFAEDDLAA